MRYGAETGWPRHFLRIVGPDLGIGFDGVNPPRRDVASLAAARNEGLPVIAYGNFINAVIKFVIVAFALFLVIKNVNKLKSMMEREEEKATEIAPPPRNEILLEEIRDAIRARN